MFTLSLSHAELVLVRDALDILSPHDDDAHAQCEALIARLNRALSK
jgi:hypothetical protein